MARRREMVAKLPYDRRVEWLQGGGDGSYIDFGFIPLTKGVIEAEIEMPNLKCRPIGCGNMSNGSVCCVVMATANSSYNWFPNYYGPNEGTQWSDPVTSMDIRSGKVNLRYEFESGLQNYYVNDTLVDTKNRTCSVPFLHTFKCFRVTGSVSGCDFFANSKIYRIKYTDADRTLDVIPVVKKGVGYMYDKVSGKLFGNAYSSGAFTWGEISAASNGGGV